MVEKTIVCSIQSYITKCILMFCVKEEISFNYREIINVFCFGIGLKSRSELCCRANTRGKRTGTAVCLWHHSWKPTFDLQDCIFLFLDVPLTFFCQYGQRLIMVLLARDGKVYQCFGLFVVVVLVCVGDVFLLALTVHFLIHLKKIRRSP